MTLPPPDKSLQTQYAALIGFDWGDKTHALAHQTDSGQTPTAKSLPHSAEKIHRWLDQLEADHGARPLALAIEGTQGPVFSALQQRPWLDIYSVHPAPSSRFRSAFTPSGAKDDQPDAQLLLELLRCHRHKLTRLDPDDELTRRIDTLTRVCRELIDPRSQHLNPLTAALKSYYSQALQLIGNRLEAPLARDFLRRWPDLLSLKRARPATIKKFYYEHNVRSQSLLEQRLDIIAQARCLHRDLVLNDLGQRQVQLLCELIAVQQQHLHQYDRDIAAAMKEHPDAQLFNNLPGAAPALAPRRLALFGTQRDRYPDPICLQKYVGVAPVKEKSGDQQWIHWRWMAPKFRCQSLVQWARQSALYCDWARAYYQQQESRGKPRQTILRSLAFKWIRILWTRWQTHTPYEDAKYTAQLRRPKSPLAALLAAHESSNN